MIRDIKTYVTATGNKRLVLLRTIVVVCDIVLHVCWMIRFAHVLLLVACLSRLQSARKLYSAVLYAHCCEQVAGRMAGMCSCHP